KDRPLSGIPYADLLHIRPAEHEPDISQPQPGLYFEIVDLIIHHPALPVDFRVDPARRRACPAPAGRKFGYRAISADEDGDTRYDVAHPFMRPQPRHRCVLRRYAGADAHKTRHGAA